MATVAVTLESFDQVLEKNEIVILDFWAEWCGPCVRFAPVFEALSEKHQDVLFGKVDTEDQKELAHIFQIRSIPMIMVFRQKIPVFGQPGALPAAAVEDVLQQVRDLDMEDVKAKYEAMVSEVEKSSG